MIINKHTASGPNSLVTHGWGILFIYIIMCIFCERAHCGDQSNPLKVAVAEGDPHYCIIIPSYLGHQRCELGLNAVPFPVISSQNEFYIEIF